MINVPGWVVLELTRAWIGFSRNKVPPTLDEAFAVKPEHAHPADRRKTDRDKHGRALQVQDLMERCGLGAEAARAKVASETGLSERTIADNHREYLRRSADRK